MGAQHSSSASSGSVVSDPPSHADERSAVSSFCSDFDLTDDAGSPPETNHFQPAVHIVSQPLNDNIPTATFSDLGLSSSPLSARAFTGPFPLLSPLAVELHRRDILQPAVLDNCMSQTWESSVQLRGIAPKYSAFIHEFWNSTEIKKLVSQAAGVDLVPVMDYEICHTNIQIKTPGPGIKSVLEQVRDIPVDVEASGQSSVSVAELKHQIFKEENMIVEWHKDCYPFVVIVMLSNPRGMDGGETVLRKGDGSLEFVKAPEMGQALVFQGSQIFHAALPTINLTERITAVTSFRPEFSDDIPAMLTLKTDMSHLGNVRRYSLLSELYYQWTIYRLSTAKNLLENMIDQLHSRYTDATTNPPGSSRGLCHTHVVKVEELRQLTELMTTWLTHTVDEIPKQ